MNLDFLGNLFKKKIGKKLENDWLDFGPTFYLLMSIYENFSSKKIRPQLFNSTSTNGISLHQSLKKSSKSTASINSKHDFIQIIFKHTTLQNVLYKLGYIPIKSTLFLWFLFFATLNCKFNQHDWHLKCVSRVGNKFWLIL